VSFLPTTFEQCRCRADLRTAALTAFAMELVPRDLRAQSMDALSSQGAGVRLPCAIVARRHAARFFPLNMTAAGTVHRRGRRARRRRARLQAIATSQAARRRGQGVRRPRRRRRRNPVDGAKAIELELETLEGPAATPAR
jgi:NAD(P) transhydrogenase subunit alpha